MGEYVRAAAVGGLLGVVLALAGGYLMLMFASDTLADF